MGQYGNERWDSGTREFTSPEPPRGLQAFRDELPRLLAAERRRRTPSSRRRASPSRCTPAGCPTPRRRSCGSRQALGGRRASGTGSPSSRAGWCSRSARPACTRGSRSRPRSPSTTRRRAVRRRRPRRPRGVRGGPPAPRPGPAHAAGLLRLARSRRRSPSSPTSWSTARPACSGCCPGSPTTRRRSGLTPPDPRGDGRVAAVLQPGETLERVVHRRVTAAEVGPAGRERGRAGSSAARGTRRTARCAAPRAAPGAGGSSSQARSCRVVTTLPMVNAAAAGTGSR